MIIILFSHHFASAIKTNAATSLFCSDSSLMVPITTFQDSVQTAEMILILPVVVIIM